MQYLFRMTTIACEAVKSGWRDGIDALMDAGADPFLVSDDDDHPFRNRSAADMSVYDAPPAARVRLLERMRGAAWRAAIERRLGRDELERALAQAAALEKEGPGGAGGGPS